MEIILSDGWREHYPHAGFGILEQHLRAIQAGVKSCSPEAQTVLFSLVGYIARPL
jgi:hypothetical protein